MRLSGKYIVIANRKSDGKRLSLCSLGDRYWLAALPNLTTLVTIFPDVFVHEVFCGRTMVSHEGEIIKPEDYSWIYER